MVRIGNPVIAVVVINFIGLVLKAVTSLHAWDWNLIVMSGRVVDVDSTQRCIARGRFGLHHVGTVTIDDLPAGEWRWVRIGDE